MNTITIDNKEYPIRFDVNVLGAVQKRYGKVDKLSENLESVEEVSWILSVLINEGLMYEAHVTHAKVERLTSEEIGLLLEPKDLLSGKVSQTIIDAFNASLGDEKNVTAEELIAAAASAQNSTQTEKTET